MGGKVEEEEGKGFNPRATDTVIDHRFSRSSHTSVFEIDTLVAPGSIGSAPGLVGLVSA